jgi:hypothetical protein
VFVERDSGRAVVGACKREDLEMVVTSWDKLWTSGSRVVVVWPWLGSNNPAPIPECHAPVKAIAHSAVVL